MRKGYDGHSRRRKRFQRVEPLPRSQSLNAISNQPLRHEQRTNCGSSGAANNLPGSQHLPPLGLKGRRSSEKQQQKQYSSGERDSRHVLGRSSSWGPALNAAGCSSQGSAVVQPPGWTHFADVFVQAGQAAGIAFQWTETQTTASAIAAPRVCGGLSVVGVAEGSLAARHGGVSPGMMLVEISRERVAGMGQENMMRLMRQVASQPRVLTLARIAGYPPPPPSPSPSPRAGDPGPRSAEARPEEMVIKPVEDKPGAPECTSAASRVVVNASRETTPGTASTLGRFSREYFRPYAQGSLPSDANGENSPSRGSSGSAPLERLDPADSNKQVSAGSSVPPTSWQNFTRNPRAPTSSSPQQLIALRFVGSRGNTSLFDRDHVLGLKARDIEFVTTNTHAGGGLSHPSRLIEERRRANSRRSLQDLTRDWVNDPFSTPARRRRLINDVCKVIVRSYTHASASRVAELRREEFFIVRIQAVCRMRQARRLFCAKLADRRIKAASVIQLGWLSHTARRRVEALRAERDHDRRVEEDKRVRREARERRERRRREEEEREREEREERHRRDLRMAVLVQRRFRVQREARQRLAQDAKRIRREQQRKATASLQAAIIIQAAFLRLQHRRRWLQEMQAQQERVRGKVDDEGRACIRLQTFWRRCAAFRALDRRKRDSAESSTFALLSDEQTAGRSDGGDDPYPPNGASGSPQVNTRKLLGRKESEGIQGEASSWQNWSSALGVNSSLAAEIAREETQANAASVENPRPWTAAGAVEQSTATARVGRPRGQRPPPAGMMTVTVRRGSQETNLVTPIVLTESGSEGEVRGETPSSELLVDSASGATATGPTSSGSDDNKSVGRGPHVSLGVQNVVNHAEVVGVIPAVYTDAPPEDRGSTTRKEANIVVAAMAVTSTPSPPEKPTASGTMVTRSSLLLARGATIGAANDGRTVRQPTGGAVREAMKAVAPREAASHGGPQVAASTPTNKVIEEANHTVVKSSEHLFMEDTQVYLGCAVCGVKYLVEAVDPGMAKSVEAGQPAPEVLYLCTTCGGTLRNNGEDGRWRRRRRPSSAPAAGRRRGSDFFFNGASGDNGARKGNTIGRADAEGRHGSPSDAAADVPSSTVEPSRKLLLAAGGGVPDGGSYSVTRLMYAHCARKVQHAYRDFRHRQYLRDWAFSLLRRWLTCRVRSRRRVKRRLRRHHAVVTVQSAIRAAFARTRCGALRAARLRRWVDRFAVLYGDDGDDFSASPVAIELLQGMNTPPPPPSPPKTPVLSQPPALSPQCSAGARPRGGVRSGAKNMDRGRALAEALAPRMGRPPPGCPAPLDVDWGEWGVGFSVVFPPSPCVG